MSTSAVNSICVLMMFCGRWSVLVYTKSLRSPWLTLFSCTVYLYMSSCTIKLEFRLVSSVSVFNFLIDVIVFRTRKATQLKEVENDARRPSFSLVSYDLNV